MKLLKILLLISLVTFSYPFRRFEARFSTSAQSKISIFLKNVNIEGIAGLRKEYSSKGLLENDIPEDPYLLFKVRSQLILSLRNNTLTSVSFSFLL